MDVLPDQRSKIQTGTLERLRIEPFRVFFPLAFLLGAAGVAHWVLLSTGALDRYLAFFHAITQMEAFMLAFASGFLLTAIPKRTRSAPASWVEIGAIALLLPTVSVAALMGAIAAGQLAYAAVLVVLAQFAVRRFASRAAGRRPPPSFVLVPVGLLAGFAGAILLILSEAAPVAAWVYPLGRALVLEGVFLCLALGVGPFFLSVALHGETSSDISRDTLTSIVGYATAGAALLLSLGLHAGGFVRAGLILRAGVVAVVLLLTGAWRRPSRPGRNRQLMWAAIWMLPAGLTIAAIFPEHRVAAMHVTFIGGFGTLAFSVAAHVTLGHGGYNEDQAGRPRAVAWFGALFAAAMMVRFVGTVVSTKYFETLAVAATIWLAAACVWAFYLLPKMWRAPLPTEAMHVP
jgi:uncharacterized protein involved in response to NO